MKRPHFALALCALAVSSALAQTQQKVHPPIAQFWMDAATNNMSMPGMEDMDDMPMLGNMMGNAFGNARNGMSMPGKFLDSALFTRNKPGGTEGQHGIPSVMSLGNSLTLLPVQVEKSSGGGRAEEGELEKPKGRMLFYWGCSETVRAGQPRVIDFAKASFEDYSKFMVGRHAPDRGAKAIPGRSVWPNKLHNQRVPKDASLLGDHSLAGDGVPAPWQFAVGGYNDFMSKLRMNAAGDLQASVPVTWEGIDTATGYFMSAMSAREDQDGTPEMILWSSSNEPDPGWGLMAYLTPTRVNQLIKEKVVLPPDARKCAVPQGIFGKTEGAMVRMIAYGPELNLAHPPRPTDPKVDWKPDWAVRLRLKSTSMAMLGQDATATSPTRGGNKASNKSDSSPPQAPSAPSASDIVKEIVNPVNVLKGLFGR